MGTWGGLEKTFPEASGARVTALAGGGGPGARQLLPRASLLPPQLIYNAGVSFMAIMFAWSGLACLIFLNCAFNWPSEAFPSPEEVNYK